MVFLMHVATIQPSNKNRQESKQESKKNNLFAVYNSDTPLNFKQGQGHQTYNENVDP